MISVHSSGVIGTAGVLAIGSLATAILGAPGIGHQHYFPIEASPSYVAATADSSRANTVWVAVSASTAPADTDFQKLAVSLAMEQHPLSSEFDLLLADRFEDLLD
jgi:hypothetical protein